MPANKTSTSAIRAFPKQTPATDACKCATELIDARIGELRDWRGEVLGRLRALILATNSEIVEEWKWNVPVWSCDGIICTGETYKKAVKLTFPKGASLPDPSKIFNASLEGNTRRAIDFVQGSRIDDAALGKLIIAAIAANRSAKPVGKAKGTA